MRFPYPRGWTFYTPEEKKKWMDENGQRISDEIEDAKKKFMEEIKRREGVKK